MFVTNIFSTAFDTARLQHRPQGDTSYLVETKFLTISCQLFNEAQNFRTERSSNCQTHPTCSRLGTIEDPSSQVIIPPNSTHPKSVAHDISFPSVLKENKYKLMLPIESYHMTSPQPKRRRPCWCTKPIP